MSLTQLPDVLMQCICHSLQSIERLRFAQCSSRLLHLSSAPFAWQHAAPIPLSINSLSIPSHRLLPLIPLALFIPAQCHNECTAAILSLCASNCRVVELRVLDRHALGSVDWAEVFACPSVHRHLQLLKFTPTTEETVQLACESLPRLHTLICAAELGVEAFSKLSLCPSLTCLSVEDSFGKPLESCLPPVLALTTLRRLRVTWLSAYGESFLPFCASPGIRDLEDLFLGWFFPEGDANFDALPVPAETIAAGFACLTRLHTLTLADCGRVHLLLSSVHLLPTLRRLTVHLGYDQTREAEFTPFRAALLALLQALPQLRCQLVHREKAAKRDPLDAAVVEILAQLVPSSPPRLTVHQALPDDGQVEPPLWHSVFGSGIR